LVLALLVSQLTGFLPLGLSNLHVNFFFLGSLSFTYGFPLFFNAFLAHVVCMVIMLPLQPLQLVELFFLAFCFLAMVKVPESLLSPLQQLSLHLCVDFDPEGF